MKVLYWNCTSPGLGGNSFAQAKKNIINYVVATLDPDVICLDEIAAAICDGAAANAYATNHLNHGGASYESANVVENPGVHLNTSTWVKEGVAYRDVTSGLPKEAWYTDQTKRDLTRLRRAFGMHEITVWFQHANASRSGGRVATDLAADYVRNKRHVFIGDFNFPITDARNAVPPNVGTHNFTQWKKDIYGSKEVPNHLPPVKYTPHSIIDYIICDQALITVTAVDSVARFGDNGLLGFITNFDHFPIVYDISPK